ncbi:SAM-dependent methyltransferase [Lamprobacter modestohalophilus]|uniref:SAM-dependent methyltransferase n=1 Tax=Lamprobacter modestohalophilus TaxID=1064514 RepID=A0A9X0WA67_9GAMM|nr:methyltransferase domain-containing protein [Lamprobacter modestohalophilus]MBK1619840.1 SAM-dependent methyltransferase [Lamprobacter modestohalophilus]
MSQQYSEAVETARGYYNSEDADNFYFHVWGGEDIHIGLYESADEPIATASARTVERIADRIAAPLSQPDARVIDLGSGYGGAARHLSKRFGCQVLALNLSEAENQRNRQMNQAAGLDHLIEVVDASFEEIPAPDARFDIAWSQDAILHSGHRDQVMTEVDRILKPGGELIFTDPMQADDCPAGVLQPIFDRIHLSSLGSFAFYREQARRLGWEEIEVLDLTENLITHYARVADTLREQRDSLKGKVSEDYIERMLTGLGHWVEGGRNGYLSWGIMHFRKSA